MSTITVSAFRWVPPPFQGEVRDLRVRWALEEAGLTYRERLIGPEDQDSAAYRALQPFGQVPAFEEDGFALFESGAIVLHVAERAPALLPAAPDARARVVAWCFAALNSVEPFVQNFAEAEFSDEPWAALRRPDLRALAERRCADLSAALGDRDYLEGGFTAADILMATVLRALKAGTVLRAYPALDRYVARCEARPAFGRALDAQMSAFRAHVPRAG